RRAGHRPDLPVDPAVPEHDRPRQHPGRGALPPPRLGGGRGVPAAVGGGRGVGGPGARARAAGVRGPRRQGRRAREEPAVRRSAAARDRPRPGDRAEAPAAGRADRRDEPAGDGDPDRVHRPPATGARALRAPDRAPHGSRHGHLGPHHRARLRDPDRRGDAGRGPARLEGHRGLPRQGVRGGADPGMSATPLLELRDVHTYYGNIRALKGISVAVSRGEVVTLIGSNGAGKTTTLKTVMGTLRPLRGSVSLDGRRIDGVGTDDRVRLGIAQSPEGRRIFPRMTVLENLELGAFARKDHAAIRDDFERVLTLFPRLRERLAQKGGTLSGGEQQMLAIGRALMARPTVLLLDEPSMRLSPILVETIFEIIQAINRQGTTILLVEQNARLAL